MALNVYDSREEVWVDPFSGSGIKYGFLTNVESARRTILGHNPVNRANPPTALVFGANRPKPGRASKKFGTENTSSFYDVGQASALRADGWSLSRAKIRRGGSSNLSTAYYVTIEGIKYAWNMPNHTANRVGADLAGLGIQQATGNDRDLVWGASYPKPPRAIAQVGNDRISTFVDPSRIDSLPDGWASSGSEEV